MESDTSSSSNDDDDDKLLDAAEVICVAEAVLAWRSNRMTRSRLHWQHHVQMLLHENQFHVMHRMMIGSFNIHLKLTQSTAEQTICSDVLQCNNIMQHHVILYNPFFSWRILPQH
jgi:hypothetical protein